jgi:CrcB protein
MLLSFAVAIFAGIGAVSRYALDQVVQQRTRGDFPSGTFLVNMLGSLLLGLLVGLGRHHGLDARVGTVAGAGFAGGFTTLSTWAWETLALAEAGELSAAAWNVLGSFGVGLLAAAAGFGLALL